MDGLGNQLGPDADTLRDNIGFVGSPHCCIQDMKPWIGADGLLEASRNSSQVFWSIPVSSSTGA